MHDLQSRLAPMSETYPTVDFAIIVFAFSTSLF